MKKIILTDSGQSYMRTILGECAGAARILAERVSKPGVVFAPLPRGTTAARALQFETGGLSSRIDALCWLFEDLSFRVDGTVIVQDIWSQPSDLEAGHRRIDTYLVENNQVYYYLPRHSLSLGTLKDLHKQVKSFQFVAFYVANAKHLEQFRGHDVPSGFVEELARLACAVYMSAYDQESWVVWEAAV